MPEVSNPLYRKLPSVDELLRLPSIAQLVSEEGPDAAAEAVRAVLARIRNEISAGRLDQRKLELAIQGLSAGVEQELHRQTAFSLRAVINATGVVLHTNLGRAPLGDAAIMHVQATAAAYSNLEFDLSTGERGKRDVHAQRLFRKLLAQHAPAGYDVQTVVVNNCAAAVLLALNSLAEGGEVVVSRGELVEIGGSFRVPEVMAKSGAILREVGTTNRTRLADYENAVNEKTRLLLRVHRSNFAIVGFTEQPTLAELTDLGRRRGIPVMEDLGNGALLELRELGVDNEPGLTESLRSGADIITYSGDKLLGGPQAGMLTGRGDLIAKVRSNPLFRALRVDKLTYAALEATLLDYVRGNRDGIPALRMLRLTADSIRARAEKLIAGLSGEVLKAKIIAGESLIGGGAAPTSVLPTFLVALTSSSHSAEELQTALRRGAPPVIVRVEEGKALLDLRTVFAEQDTEVFAALQALSRA